MLSRLLGIDDRILIREYEEFAQEKAKLITDYPVYLEVIKDWKIDGTRGNVRPGGNLGWNMTYSFGNKNSGVEFSWLIRISRRIFRLLKYNQDAMEKIICHELAHIKCNDHDENFTSLAIALGAGECAYPAFNLECRISPKLAKYDPIIRHLPGNLQERLLLYLGGVYGIHKSDDKP